MASTLTVADLDALERLEAAATPGPWEASHGSEPIADTGDYLPWVRVEGLEATISHFEERPYAGGESQEISDARFVAASRTAFRELLALARKGLAADTLIPAAPAAQPGGLIR